MKIAVLYAHPVEPDGLSIQGNLLYRGLKELGVDVMPCHYAPSFQKQWTMDAFKPDIAIGVGGYASGPIVKAAARRKIPILIQEQNSYAGLTNKLLAKKANKICVAYQGMERFFPSDKILMTGNPVRKDLAKLEDLRPEAQQFFNIDPSNIFFFICM
jgi:UDP-N-acetylglucosamine--N-acetylmuramyl-(pentapeptide) pyrophosphoryl-undecaprenol N-acetylglucosamine transferase